MCATSPHVDHQLHPALACKVWYNILCSVVQQELMLSQLQIELDWHTSLQCSLHWPSKGQALTVEEQTTGTDSEVVTTRAETAVCLLCSCKTRTGAVPLCCDLLRGLMYGQSKLLRPRTLFDQCSAQTAVRS